MKRLLAGLLTFAMLLIVLAGCGQQTQNKQQDASQSSPVEAGYEAGVSIRVAALKGPTAMGLVRLMEDNKQTTEHYQFDLYANATEIVPLLGKGEVDIALIPTNLAATLYQKTEGDIQVLDVNAGNVLYAVSHNDSLTKIEDLKGKIIFMTGKGTTPEWTLRYLLSKSGIAETDVTIEFKSEPAEVVAALGQNTDVVGILPQPFATVAMMQNQEIAMNFPLEDAWMQYSPDGKGIATGVTVVRKGFAEEHPAAVAQFIKDHQQSVEYIAGNPEQAAQLIEQYGIVKAPVAQEVLENFSPVVSSVGKEMQSWVSGYLEMLYEVAPDAVGGTLPDEGFYYLG